MVLADNPFRMGALFGLMGLAFWVWWPLGLGVLVWMIGSGQMGCGRHRGRWGGSGMGWGCGPRRDERDARSGNSAFDDYRRETLRRLEEEEREFRAYLERLRQARDKTEFDRFMAERNQPRPPEPSV